MAKSINGRASRLSMDRGNGGGRYFLNFISEMRLKLKRKLRLLNLKKPAFRNSNWVIFDFILSDAYRAKIDECGISGD